MRARRIPRAPEPTPEPTPEPPPTPAPAPGAGPTPPSELGSWLRTAVTFAPPLTVVTALMFYFGWARANEEARQLGIDVAVLGMSTQDYLLISIASLYVPLGAISLVLLGWLFLHRRLAAAVTGGRHLAAIGRFARVLQTAWLVLPVAAWFVERAWPQYRDTFLPAAIAVGVLLTAYGGRLRRIVDGRPPARLGAAELLIGAVVALALFWELSTYAGIVGNGLAEQVIDGQVWRPGVVLYSPKDLQITAPGVAVTTFGDSRSQFAFRYSGLRLLQQSGGKYFLLPDGWTPRRRIVLVIPDDGSVRVEFDTDR